MLRRRRGVRRLVSPSHNVRVEPRRAVLSGAVPAYPHGRSQGLGNGTGAQGEPAQQDESPGGVPHFPEGPAQLYEERKYRRPEVNALANFCFQTKDTNLEISDRLPEEYFPTFEARHPGGLTSQWIPMDQALWKMDRFRDFLEARKELLAAELNRRMGDLLHGDTRWLASAAATAPVPAGVPGGITSEGEEAQLESLNEWMEAAGFPRGVVAYDFSDPQSGEQKAVFDLVWPNGIQEELSQPVAVLLNEERQTLALAS